MTFFRKQNTILLLIFIITAIVYISYIPESHLLCFSIIFLIYCLPDPDIYLRWLKLLLKVLPLFSFILLVSVFFTNNFIEQSYLLFRWSLLILVSVYFTRTITFKGVFSDTHAFMRFSLYKKSLIYFSAVSYFLPHFFITFKKSGNQSSPENKNILSVVTANIGSCYLESYSYISDFLSQLNQEYELRESRDLYSLSNIYLLVFLLIINLFVSL